MLAAAATTGAKPLVVAGSANQLFAARLTQQLGTRLVQGEAKRFPDQEGYVRLLEDVRGQDLLVVQSTAPDAHFVELLLWADAAWESGARSVTAVIPYMGYARQDRIFKPGEAVSSRAAAKAVASAVDKVVTVDPHKEDILQFFGGKATSVSAVPELARELKAWGIDTILAPDKGARDRAMTAAKLIGARVDHLEKTRLSPTEVVMAVKDLDVRGSRVAILDDLIASGGTMVSAAKQLKLHGALQVDAACTHGLFTGGAVPKILSGGIDRILTTDTVEAPGHNGLATTSAATAVARVLMLEHALL